MLLRGLLAPVLLTAAVARAADLPTCPSLVIQAQGASRALTPGKDLDLKIRVTNTGLTSARGLGLSVASSVATNWRVPRKFTPVVDWPTVTFLDNEPLPPRKSRRYKVKGKVCLTGPETVGMTKGKNVSEPLTVAEVAFFSVDTESNAVCMTGASLNKVSEVFGRGRVRGSSLDGARRWHWHH